MANLQPQMVPGQYNRPVIMNTQPQPSFQIARYASTFNKLGIAQIVLGIGSIVFGIVLIILAASIINYNYMYVEYVGAGIWCGIFFLISGSLGCASAKKHDPCLVTGGMVMAIFSALSATTLISFEIVGAISSAQSYHYPYYPYYESYDYMTALHSVLCVIAFAEFVIAITHSAYCCAASSCCCADTPPPQTFVSTGVVNPMHNSALPAQMNACNYVTQPQQFGATIQLPAGNYYSITNQPVGTIPTNNTIVTRSSNGNQPPQYQNEKNPAQLQ